MIPGINTGGGGLSNSSSAAAGTGEQYNNAQFHGGSVNFGAASGGVSNWLIIGGAVLLGLYLWKGKR